MRHRLHILVLLYVWGSVYGMYSGQRCRLKARGLGVRFLPLFRSSSSSSNYSFKKPHSHLSVTICSPSSQIQTGFTAPSVSADTCDMWELITSALPPCWPLTPLQVALPLPDRKQDLGVMCSRLYWLESSRNQQSPTTLITKPQALFHTRDWEDVIHYKQTGNRLSNMQHVASIQLFLWLLK